MVVHVPQGRSPGEHDLSQYEPVRGYVALVKEVLLGILTALRHGLKGSMAAGDDINQICILQPESYPQHTVQFHACLWGDAELCLH